MRFIMYKQSKICVLIPKYSVKTRSDGKANFQQYLLSSHSAYMLSSECKQGFTSHVIARATALTGSVNIFRKV